MPDQAATNSMDDAIERHKRDIDVTLIDGNLRLTVDERLGLAGSFETIVTADDVSRLKPAPDVYLEAARRVSVEPSRAVAIEDSAPGLASARAAVMATVATELFSRETAQTVVAPIAFAAAFLVYEVVQLTLWGRTVGKRLTGAYARYHGTDS